MNFCVDLRMDTRMDTNINPVIGGLGVEFSIGSSHKFEG